MAQALERHLAWPCVSHVCTGGGEAAPAGPRTPEPQEGRETLAEPGRWFEGPERALGGSRETLNTQKRRWLQTAAASRGAQGILGKVPVLVTCLLISALLSLRSQDGMVRKGWVGGCYPPCLRLCKEGGDWATGWAHGPVTVGRKGPRSRGEASRTHRRADAPHLTAHLPAQLQISQGGLCQPAAQTCGFISVPQHTDMLFRTCLIETHRECHSDRAILDQICLHGQHGCATRPAGSQSPAPTARSAVIASTCHRVT